MVSSAREIEQKFVLPDGAELPSFADLDGVASVSAPQEHHLVATYYDTADLRLIGAGIALRRRRGGQDAGWHLKESVALDERLELHAPLGRTAAGVPAPLHDLVRSRTRGRDLVPVASLDSRRVVRRLVDGDGSTLAEVADDHVTGTSLGPAEPILTVWREVEIELVDGDRHLLSAAARRLAEAGAEPAGWSSKLGHALAHRLEPGDGVREPMRTAGQVVVAHLVEQVEALVMLDPLVRRDHPDSVHKMRVATRRLRSALATFRRLLDRSVTDPLRDELKWLATVLGTARDAEVIHARLDELVDGEPPTLVRGAVAARIDTTMAERRATARHDVTAVLDSERYWSLLDALDEVAAGAALSGRRADRRAERALPTEVRRSWRRWQRDVDALVEADEADAMDVALHDVRKASKRVRYAGEAVAPAVGPRATRLAERMEELQEVLGRHQDGIVTARVLADLATDAHAAGEDTFTYGRLHAAEAARAAAAAVAGRRLIAERTERPPGWLR